MATSMAKNLNTFAAAAVSSKKTFNAWVFVEGSSGVTSRGENVLRPMNGLHNVQH